ncbi:hypothetical protein HZH68_015388 [Vespula germanica]|uniref:Uncharacterized protein n=1 Tax=Vespula germanica TaxID=30212 RepID=A0A834J8P0_VESGE|nr:hypothetical protein HZH68_015388 [Vespula germanica]
MTIVLGIGVGVSIGGGGGGSSAVVVVVLVVEGGGLVLEHNLSSLSDDVEAAAVASDSTMSPSKCHGVQFILDVSNDTDVFECQNREKLTKRLS